MREVLYSKYHMRTHINDHSDSFNHTGPEQFDIMI